MRKSGSILRSALVVAATAASSPGATPLFIDNAVRKFIERCGAHPAFLGYEGYPASTCISINSQVVHCIPSDTPILKGDIVGVDCGVEFEGAITDACRTVCVGKVAPRTKKLVITAYSALVAGIKEAKPGARVGDISYAIQKTVESAGFSVSREFVGHAVGPVLHSPPWIPNYGRAGRGALLKAGMFIAIEPVIFDGNWHTKLEGDWNTVSVDGNLSAHVEDTIYVSPEGPVVIT